MAVDGKLLHDWMGELFPISRSIVGPGFDQSLNFLIEKIDGVGVSHEYPTGNTYNGWTVPESWELVRGQILDLQGKVVIDSNDSNLHVWSHSIPFNGQLSRKDLENHLLSLPENRDAIPYATTYYKSNWGFSLTHNQYLKLTDDFYKVRLETKLKPGNLKMHEVYLPGESKSEIFFSTYLCHPSMANNELSGPVIWAALINALRNKKLKYSYRFVIGPETIGPACYLSSHLDELKENSLAAFNLTCVGDPNGWNFLHSPSGNSYSDKIALATLDSLGIKYISHDFLKRGSDERMYASAKVNIPMVSIMRSKYTEYAEYHNSLDDMSFVTPQGLQETLDYYINLIQLVECDGFFTTSVVGEPFLSHIFQFPLTGGRFTENRDNSIELLKDLLAFSRGSTISDLATKLGRSTNEIIPPLNQLVEANLIEKIAFGD